MHPCPSSHQSCSGGSSHSGAGCGGPERRRPRGCMAYIAWPVCVPHSPSPRTCLGAQGPKSKPGEAAPGPSPRGTCSPTSAPTPALPREGFLSLLAAGWGPCFSLSLTPALSPHSPAPVVAHSHLAHTSGSTVVLGPGIVPLDSRPGLLLLKGLPVPPARTASRERATPWLLTQEGLSCVLVADCGSLCSRHLPGWAPRASWHLLGSGCSSCPSSPRWQANLCRQLKLCCGWFFFLSSQ